jgi:toxin ParE1/3/4
MTRAISRTAQAEEDLIEIWGYVALHNERAADRLLDRFEARWRLLATQPYSGMARDDIAQGVRHLVTGEYLTFYRVSDDAVVILRVIHGRRDIAAEDIGNQDTAPYLGN